MDASVSTAKPAVVQRRRKNEQRVSLTCPACEQERSVRVSDWRKRKSDHCQPCGNRLRVGLEPDPGERTGKGTRLYNIWRDMRQRCGLFAGAKAQDRATYIERGIAVCDAWARAFSPFRDWAMSSGYADEKVLDRRDNDGGYSPENCHWTTVQANNRNRRCVKLTEADVAVIKTRLAAGARGEQRRIAREYGMSEAIICNIKKGKIWADVLPA